MKNREMDPWGSSPIFIYWTEQVVEGKKQLPPANVILTDANPTKPCGDYTPTV